MYAILCRDAISNPVAFYLFFNRATFTPNDFANKHNYTINAVATKIDQVGRHNWKQCFFLRLFF